MTGVLRNFAALIIATLMAAPAKAAEPAAPADPPPPPRFFVHAGATGIFPQVNGQATGGGLFGVYNIAIRPVYTVTFEIGYYVTPNIALAVFTGVPPIWHFKSTGSFAAPFHGTNLTGSTRTGAALLLLQYHFDQFGRFQPYAGIGGGYSFNFGNFSDGILSNFSFDQNFVFALQAGANFMLTPNWGFFVDAKKAFYSTDAQGLFLTFDRRLRTFVTHPVRTHVTLDPWVASAGITFKY
ncbi:MAG: outer membrane beta-barrel protein [Beijerinckiaceae bacterium]|nr:outer membrane beta-barrel protein [Beijerinckiaceae bacterium]